MTPEERAIYRRRARFGSHPMALRDDLNHVLDALEAAERRAEEWKVLHDAAAAGRNYWKEQAEQAERRAEQAEMDKAAAVGAFSASQNVIADRDRWRQMAEESAEALAEIAGLADDAGGQHLSAGLAKNALARYELALYEAAK